MSIAGQTVKRMAMELGGKNPFIVLEDADLDMAVESGVHSQYYNAGQICAAPGKFYIHEKVYDQFVAKFVEKASKIKVGVPEDVNTEMGPLASERTKRHGGRLYRLGGRGGGRQGRSRRESTGQVQKGILPDADSHDRCHTEYENIEGRDIRPGGLHVEILIRDRDSRVGQ